MNNLQSDTIEELVAALVKAQSEIRSAEEDSTNPHFRSKYASYEAIRLSCKGPLIKNSLIVTHHLADENGKRIMVTQVTHVSGQWMRSCLSLPQSDKETPQQVGSSITYAKRYTLSALLAICTGEDDDGEAAQQPFRQEATLTEEQALEISDHIGDDTGLMNRILNGYKVQSLTQIPASNYKAIITKLNQRGANVTSH